MYALDIACILGFLSLYFVDWLFIFRYTEFFAGRGCVALRILTISLELGRPIRAFSSRYVVNQRFAAKAFITIPAFASQTMLTIYLLSL